ncbi:MAG: helix-turn-helix domain-containing protein [Bacteroides sp.]|nr:helix-turn-helix domain-containing protein [Bacteroides sp.]
METQDDNIPSFDSLPAFVAGLSRKVDAIDRKLDILISAPQENADLHTVLDIKEASELIGKTIGTIYSLTSQKAIPYSKRGNKLYFFKDELLAWIKAGGKADIDFRNDDNRDAYDRHLLRLRESKRRKPSNPM